MGSGEPVRNLSVILRQTGREQTARFAETFVGILGHDLRGPLAAISMATALLESQASLEGPHLKRVRQIASSTSRMVRMVDQLLDLTRARLAQGVPLARRKTDGEWDGDRLAQVASNLVGNAIEHGDRTRAIRVVLGGGDATATLTVHNEGPPIPEAILPVLFDPFRGGRLTTHATSKGLGLGLCIAREIVSAHGGPVAVRSADETTFEVTLSLVPPATSPLG